MLIKINTHKGLGLVTPIGPFQSVVSAFKVATAGTPQPAIALAPKPKSFVVPSTTDLKKMIAAQAPANQKFEAAVEIKPVTPKPTEPTKVAPVVSIPTNSGVVDVPVKVAEEIRSQVVTTPKKVVTEEIRSQVVVDAPKPTQIEIPIQTPSGGTKVSLGPNPPAQLEVVKVDISPIKEIIPGSLDYSAPVSNLIPTTPAPTASGSGMSKTIKYGLIGVSLLIGGMALLSVSSSKKAALGCPHPEPLAGVKNVRKYARKKASKPKSQKTKTINVTI